MNIRIENASLCHAKAIAPLIMEAMNHECCLYFTGSNYGLADFQRLMIDLIEQEESQYSYKNTLVALNEAGIVVGVCVSYDGQLLHTLRNAFIMAAKERFGRDFSDMEDETQAGELYIDSICVAQPFRGKGIAEKLIKATIHKGKAMKLPIGLLVDKVNPNAERLYLKLGFEFVDEKQWGGHQMKHLLHRL